MSRKLPTRRGGADRGAGHAARPGSPVGSRLHQEERTMRMPMRRPVIRPLAIGAGMLLVAAGLTVLTVFPASAATTATVSVNAGQTLAGFPAVGVGMNVAVWDGRMNDPETTTLLRNAGMTAVRYPGG